MALVSTTVWEVRIAGSANNGSGFNNRIPGTSVDYSQQNASQLSINDLVGSAASVIVTSVAAGFTNAMVGNVIYIRAGANFTTGFYEIVQFNAANSVNLDRIPCTGAGANGLAEVGGAQINLDLIDTVVVPGNIVWMKSGTYAAHPAIAFNQTYTVFLPLEIRGYDVARGDDPTANNRPLIQMVANVFTIQNVARIRNVRITGSGAQVINWITTASNIFLQNCYIENLAVAGVVYCLQGDRLVFSLIDCEFKGTAGATSSGINVVSGGGSTNFFVLNCYFHHLTNGIIFQTNNQGVYINFNIFANLANAGINLQALADIGGEILNNTFASIGRSGILSTSLTQIGLLAMNNSFSDCVVAGIEGLIRKSFNNNFFGCGTPWIGGTPSITDGNTFVTPQFVTPGSVFALQRTSGLIDRAFSMRLGV